MSEFPHVGRGWAFPPRWTSADGEPAAVALNEGAEHIGEALTLIIRTSLGERVMRPELGASADRYVFEPASEEVVSRLQHEVRRALVRWEPRVLVDSVAAVHLEGRIDVLIEYRIDRHRRPDNLVVPFYLEVPQ